MRQQVKTIGDVMLSCRIACPHLPTAYTSGSNQ